MPDAAPQPSDNRERAIALTALNQSLLVEAGAGTGKTAIMAGRILMLLGAGIAPKHIAAVTFTELAASQLAERVSVFLEEVLDGRIRPDLAAALPSGPSHELRRNLESARAEIDQLTCTTIHGFCQRLIGPYPVEADIDPGARIIDPRAAALVFQDLQEAWLRDRLSGGSKRDDLLAELVMADPESTLKLVRDAATVLRTYRAAAAPVSDFGGDPSAKFCAAVGEFRACLAKARCREEDTEEIVEGLEELAQYCTEAAEGPVAQALARLLFGPRPKAYTKSADKFAAYKKKGKWQAAAKAAGLSKAEADRFNDIAAAAYDGCSAQFEAMMEAAAAHVLSRLIDELRELLDRFRDYKRSVALLDFDDLLHGARDLLARHDEVRQALGQRYRHVLVDEFQDTDPLQIEILWRLCGDPPTDRLDAAWPEWTIRPGALFAVGDPKQAIYRFRGADVAAYVKAREALRGQADDSLVPITTNFRSVESILCYVNERFEGPLSAAGQPGFARLSHFHEGHGDGPHIAALEISMEVEEGGKVTAADFRNREAETVAFMCRRLVGSYAVRDEEGNLRPCRPGDIALLAPTGTELWRYEQALEDVGLPVSTQAGKGLYRRQEIQDLIAVARILSDARDRLALGAFLRGPLVGLTEQQLLDISHALSAESDAPVRMSHLSLWTDPTLIKNDLAQDQLARLQGLARRARSTSPYQLLSQAVEELRVRPLLRQRHGDGAERALANLDLFLETSRAYAVRGLRAFAADMSANWEEANRVVEGRPDAEEQAVSIITIHAAKGLEWPVVLPINTTTVVQGPDPVIYDREANVVRFPVYGRAPAGYQEAYDAEVTEQARENQRLWYVATTRAKDLLLLPRFDADTPRNCWLRLVDLGLAELPDFDMSSMADALPPAPSEPANSQDRAQFSSEAAAMAAQRRTVEWVVPSRSEGRSVPAAEAEFMVYGEPIEQEIDVVGMPQVTDETPVQGGRERGLVLHKLMEEILTGEVGDADHDLLARAEALVRELGIEPTEIAEMGLSPTELASTVRQTLELSDVAALRERLVPECCVYSSTSRDTSEQVVSGIADALSMEPDGSVAVVLDWKSDIDPQPETIDHYRQQIAAYQRATGAKRGLIVFMTSGKVIEVLVADHGP